MNNNHLSSAVCGLSPDEKILDVKVTVISFFLLTVFLSSSLMFQLSLLGFFSVLVAAG